MVDLVSTPFAQSLMPAVMDASKATGVHPGVILAQAALESGFGKHAPGNNFFGIKAPSGNTLATTEVVNGQPVQTTGTFGAYDSPAASVAAYADFINRNPRYAAMRAAPDMDSQIAELGKSGYATDPNYAAKISAIAHGMTFDPNSAPASLPAAAPTSATGSMPLSAPASGVSPPDAGSLLSAALAANSTPTAPQTVAPVQQQPKPIARTVPAAQLAQALLSGQSGNLLLG